MSYDIVLLSEAGVLMRDKVYDFFASRPNCEASPTDIMYDNPETDVHFQWVFTPFHHDETNEEDAPVHEKEIGHLRLNFCRPTAFAKEASIELQALSETLPVQFYDLPQDLIYERFTSADQLTIPYFEHAQKALSAIRAAEPDIEFSQRQPKRALDTVWEWNLNRHALTDSLGEDLFVPKVDFFEIDGEQKTGVVWGDGVPMLCPQVDIVIMYRDKTAPSTGWFRKKTATIDVLTFEEFEDTFGTWFSADSRKKNALSCAPSDSQVLFDAVASSPIRRKASLENDGAGCALAMVPFSEILDSEICAPTPIDGTTTKTIPL